ncbi:MAG: UvrD-helicase domain-containing protein [Alphaproteobacteria bacterium]
MAYRPLVSPDPGLPSVWISANAGSGKTTALVGRVVKLLLLGVEPERICCITYTRAAAAEMRERVLSTLRALLLADDEACREHAAKFLGRAPAAEELARARTLFGRMLDSPTGGVGLSTIHGFCQQLLRAFPIEAGVAPYFTVLEESESALLRSRAVQRLLGGLTRADAELAAALGLLIDRAHEQKFSGLLDGVFRRHAEWRALWQGASTPADMRARLSALHGIAPGVTAESLANDYCNLISGDSAALLRTELPRLAAHKNKQEQEIARVLAQWLTADCAGRVGLIGPMLSLWLTAEREPRKRLVNDKDFPPGTKLRELLDRIAAASLDYCRRRAALACAEETGALAIAGRAALDYYEQLKAERGALDYDDLIEAAYKLLSARDMTGWVMSKLDHRIDHLLIDEAQDTSKGQWAIAESLVAELVVTSGGLGSAGVARGLLVVGDEKQSIFSFQGAAPELFARMRPMFGKLLAQSSAPLAGETLAISYRSAPAILRFVDAVAARPALLPSLSALGAPEPHQLSRTGTVGEVVLYPPAAPEARTEAEPFTIPTEYRIAGSGAQLLARTIAATVKQWLDEERPLANKDRAVAPGDILILVRNRAPLVAPLIRALQRAGVPVAGLDRLTLSDHLAVRDLLALMRWCGFPGDDLALAVVLRSPLIGMGDEALRELAFGREGSLWERLRTHPSRATLERWLGARDASPYEFLTQVLEVDDARRRFAGRFGEEVHEVLDEFKEQAASPPASLPPGLASFADFIARSPREIKRESDSRGAGKVRIMTVYGAKGLEAPVVLLADTTRVPDLRHERLFRCETEHGAFPVLSIGEDSRHAPLLRAARDARRDALLAEYHRLLYVALTRACDELHIFGWEDARGTIRPESWYAHLADTLGAMDGAEKREDGRIVLRDGGVAKKSAAPSALPAKPALPEWALRPLPSRARAPTLVPSRLAAEKALAPFAGGPPGAAKERGVRIHRVLQFLAADSTRGDVAALLDAVAPDWDAETLRVAGDEIWALYRQEQWLWQGDAIAEAGISGTIEIDGTAVAVNGQIDRLVRTKEGFVILDYKTGRVPAGEADVPPNYLLQLKTYDALLAGMEPSVPRRCAILWTAGPKLMWLSDEVAAIAWQLS